MEQVLTICNSLIFLFVGYFLGKNYTENKREVARKIVKELKNLPVKAGVIEYPTQADIDYHESGEDKVDEAREKLFREQFKP